MEEIARLKKELGAKKSKQSGRKETQPQQESSSLKKYASFNRGASLDADEEFGFEYVPHNKSKKGGKGPGSSKSSSGRGNPARKSLTKRPDTGGSIGKSSTNNNNSGRAPPQAQSSLKAKSSLATAKSSLAKSKSLSSSIISSPASQKSSLAAAKSSLAAAVSVQRPVSDTPQK